MNEARSFVFVTVPAVIWAVTAAAILQSVGLWPF